MNYIKQYLMMVINVMGVIFFVICCSVLIVLALYPQKSSDVEGILRHTTNLLKINTQEQNDTYSDLSNAPAQAMPFKGEVYRMIDDRQVITFVSPDELELRVNGTNLICKYTRQDDTLRVVENIMGTTQAIYYKITTQGLRANDGSILLSPSEYRQTMEAMQLAQQRQEEERKQINLEIARSRQQTKEIATFEMTSDGLISSGHQNTPYKAVITDVSVRLYFPNNERDEIVYFSDLRALRPVRACRLYMIDAFCFSLWWRSENSSMITEMDCKDKAETEKLRSTLLQAFAEWSRKFPRAVPHVDMNKGYLE